MVQSRGARCNEFKNLGSGQSTAPHADEKSEFQFGVAQLGLVNSHDSTLWERHLRGKHPTWGSALRVMKKGPFGHSSPPLLECQA